MYSNPGSPNEFTFYTMGLDRMWDIVTELGDFSTPTDGFKNADDLWSDIPSNFIQFIRDDGGVAGTYTPHIYISRPKWADVERYLKGEIDLQTFKASMGC